MPFTGLPLLSLALLLIAPAFPLPGDDPWNRERKLGREALQQGHYAEAETAFAAALALVDKPGQDLACVADSLLDLASVYRAQGRYAQTELLDRRAVSI